MSQKIIRIALVLAVLGGAGLFVYGAFRDRTPGEEPDAPPVESDDPTDTVDWDPNAGEGEAPPKAAPGSVASVISEPVDRRAVGPELPAGTEVPVAVPYRPGTRSRYRVMNVQRITDRNTRGTAAQRWFMDVTTEVVSAAEDNPARVKLTVDSVRIQSILPNGVEFDFDSLHPDERLLADDLVGLAVRPIMATLGLPIEFAVGAAGAPEEVHGTKRWSNGFFDVAMGISPSVAREMIDPYAEATVIEEWTEMLFPPVGGGTMTVGKTRPMDLRRDTFQQSFVRFQGDLRATHDDGERFRVTMLTKPSLLTRTGASRNKVEAAVVKSRVIASDDSYHAAWEFDRKAGRLVHAEIDAAYQLHVSYLGGQDPTGQEQYIPRFLDIERKTRVDLVDE
jgi:hypothetical protein